MGCEELASRAKARNSDGRRIGDSIAAKESEIERVTASLRRCQEKGRSHAVEHLEGELESLLGEKEELEGHLSQAKPEAPDKLLEVLQRLPQVVRRHVDGLSRLLDKGRVAQVKGTLMALVDEIVVKPGRTKEGRPCHLVTVRGAVDQALRLFPRRRQSLMVAGEGFWRYLPLEPAVTVQLPRLRGVREEDLVPRALAAATYQHGAEREHASRQSSFA